jgi:hypothetical protein
VKRHPHLEPLSDDHHGALVLARRCLRAADDGGVGIPATWEDVRHRFARELEPHFRVEEHWLLPALEVAGEGALVTRTRDEHARLRELVGPPASPERLAAFGGLLHAHVRFEERELFPRAERVLTDPVLEAAGRAAREARAQAGSRR